MEKYKSPSKGYVVFLLKDVPGRSDVEIHAGNSIADTKGCILTGVEQHGSAIGRSREALASLLAALPTITEIEIINP